MGGMPEAVPLVTPTGPSTTTTYDAFGRLVEAHDLDGTLVGRNFFGPLSTRMQDAENLIPTGLHASGSVLSRLDGHGRVSDIVAVGTGFLSQRTHFTYQTTGEVISIERHGSDSHGNARSYRRTMLYDSFGRMTLNLEPNTSGFETQTGETEAWRYAYDDTGQLVGTSDARGCGKNIAYDGAGRIVFEDYSPCLSSQTPYTPASDDGNGTEAFYTYYDADFPQLLTTQVREISDRSSKS